MKLTKTVCDRATYPADHDAASEQRYVVWDDEVPGFGLRVYPSGRKVFVLRWQRAGRQRWLTIGEYGPVMTTEKARKRAAHHRLAVLDGQDPAEERRREREQTTTLAKVADEYMETAAPTLKPSTRESYEDYIAHVKAAFGRRRPDSITHEDVERWHRKMADEPHGANRRLWMLSKLLDEAERRGLRNGRNPCRGIKRYRETKRERFLSAAELARVGDALHRLETEGVELRKGRRVKVSRPAAAALRLLLFTGCRVGEVLSLRWEDVDLERGYLNLRDAKAGARAVHLNAPALAVLDGLPREGEWVFAGQRKGRPLTTVQTPWRRVCQVAGVKNVRLHDLRHTHGGWAATGGDSLLIVGALLGHKQASTTERYAHLAADPVRDASERVGAAIAAALEGKAGEVVDFRGK